jgi:hypothetical protein
MRNIGAIAVLILVISASPSLAETDDPSCDMREGRFRYACEGIRKPGDSSRAVEFRTGSYIQCKNACIAAANCAAWSWITSTRSGVPPKLCVLWPAVPQWRPNGAAMSGLR